LRSRLDLLLLLLLLAPPHPEAGSKITRTGQQVRSGQGALTGLDLK